MCISGTKSELSTVSEQVVTLTSDIMTYDAKDAEVSVLEMLTSLFLPCQQCRV